MMTNTYLPHVGGVARSVSTFADEYRKRGHQVLVVAPTFEGTPPPRRHERIVERVAAVQNFNGSDFSVRLPLAATLSSRLDAFETDVIHAHHPFLLGDTALRVGASRNVPVIFTHHTRYEDYTHYVPFDSPALKEIAINLSTQFANLCEGVIAPSESIARLIRQRGVVSPIAVVPTGIDLAAFAGGDGARARRRFRIPARAFVVGHTGRLAPEKNLGYLAKAVALFLQKTPEAVFLVIGGGPSEEKIRAVFAKHGVEHRLILAGKQTGAELHDAFAAMDVFAFASFSETQGMVLAEAMAAGVPVVALKANGVAEVVRDGVNGRLLPARTTAPKFAACLTEVRAAPAVRRKFSRAARATAQEFSKEHCAELALNFYTEIRKATRKERELTEQSVWGTLGQRLAMEWELLSRKTQSIVTALRSEPEAKAS
ncbi:MAG: glycosyltransferase [Verrucomicrobia bacterium]|nr:glycosyltransferase [Verrucomicrobiota bacterium]